MSLFEPDEARLAVAYRLAPPADPGGHPYRAVLLVNEKEVSADVDTALLLLSGGRRADVLPQRGSDVASVATLLGEDAALSATTSDRSARTRPAGIEVSPARRSRSGAAFDSPVISQSSSRERSRTSRMPNLVRSTFWNTSIAPSGDHLGRMCVTASEVSVVTWVGFRPFRSAIQMRRGPAHSASTAIWAPSGEKAGLHAFEMSRVSLPVSVSSE